MIRGVGRWEEGWADRGGLRLSVCGGLSPVERLTGTGGDGISVVMTGFQRITVKPEQMGGVPCIRGLRIPVATIVGMVADGMTEAEILEAYPDLQVQDIEEALRYAAEAVRERGLPLTMP